MELISLQDTKNFEELTERFDDEGSQLRDRGINMAEQKTLKT
jgi:hypothetical protein